MPREPSTSRAMYDDPSPCPTRKPDTAGPTTADSPSASPDTAHSPPMAAIARVRRRPSMRCGTASWMSTITRVFAASAIPRPSVVTSLTALA